MNLKTLWNNPPVTLLALLALSACGGPGGGASSSAVSAPTVAPRIADAATFNDKTSSVFTVDATTGQSRRYGEVAAGAGPVSVTVGPSGKFAYVANETANEIAVYRIDPSTGALTPVGVPVFAPHPRSITVDRSGEFLYVENKNPNTVSAYRIDAATGTLTSLGTLRNRARAFPSTLTKGSSVVAYTPKYAYVGNSNSNNVSAYRLDASRS